LAKAGKSNPARIAMIAMTTSSSISVNARVVPRLNFICIIILMGHSLLPAKQRPRWYG